MVSMKISYFLFPLNREEFQKHVTFLRRKYVVHLEQKRPGSLPLLCIGPALRASWRIIIAVIFAKWALTCVCYRKWQIFVSVIYMCTTECVMIVRPFCRNIFLTRLWRWRYPRSLHKIILWTCCTWLCQLVVRIISQLFSLWNFIVILQSITTKDVI